MRRESLVVVLCVLCADLAAQSQAKVLESRLSPSQVQWVLDGVRARESKIQSLEYSVFYDGDRRTPEGHPDYVWSVTKILTEDVFSIASFHSDESGNQEYDPERTIRLAGESGSEKIWPYYRTFRRLPGARKHSVFTPPEQYLGMLSWWPLGGLQPNKKRKNTVVPKIGVAPLSLTAALAASSDWTVTRGKLGSDYVLHSSKLRTEVVVDSLQGFVLRSRTVYEGDAQVRLEAVAFREVEEVVFPERVVQSRRFGDGEWTRLLTCNMREVKINHLDRESFSRPSLPGLYDLSEDHSVAVELRQIETGGEELLERTALGLRDRFPQVRDRFLWQRALALLIGFGLWVSIARMWARNTKR